MAQRYLLPCTNCDQKIAIVTTQAGQMVRCSGCKSEIKIGTLRDIKSLASADLGGGSSSSSDRVARNSMSVAGRAIFVFSSLMLAIGSIWGVIAMLDANQKAAAAGRFDQVTSEEKTENLRRNLKMATPKQMMEAWDELKEDAVAEWVEHPSLAIRRLAKQKRLLSWIGFGVAAVGLLGIFGSTMMKS